MSSLQSFDTRSFHSLPRIPTTTAPAIQIDPADSDSNLPPPLPRRPGVRPFRKSDETHLRLPRRSSSFRLAPPEEQEDQSIWSGLAKWAAGRWRGKSNDQAHAHAHHGRQISSSDTDTLQQLPNASHSSQGIHFSPRTISLELVRTFGIPLEVIVARETELWSTNQLSLDQSDPLTNNVPKIVQICTRWIETNAITKEGLYRVPGSHRKVTTYQVSIDTGSFDYSFPDHESPHTVASLLKKYLSSIPGGIWGSEETKIFLRNSVLSSTPQEFASILQKHLPTPSHYCTLRYLMRHLSRIASHADENKMTPENIAVVMFPGMESIVEFLIHRWQEIFGQEPQSPVEGVQPRVTVAVAAE